MNMQHKKILFMISLPEEDILENKELIQDCISRLKDRGVDIRDVICRESLSRIIDYDIVIIVTHFDKDSGNLLLKDEKLHINDFVNCLPESFSGYLDLSFCHSGFVKSEVENHCPNCITQVSNSLEGTRLYVHLVAYPFVVDKIIENEGIDFHKAYMETLEELFDAAANNPENDNYNDDSLRLGQKKASVAYPDEAKRNSLVPIHVFLHYASEKDEVEQGVYKRYTNKEVEIRICSKEFSEIEVGDSLIIELSFGGYDTQHLHVIDGKKRKIIVTEEIDEIIFMVGIDEDFKSHNFCCYIDIYMGENQKDPVKKYPFCISLVDYETEAPIHKTAKTKKFAHCVVKPESADAVIKLLHELIKGLSEPKDIMMRICAAKDAGVIRKPTWSEFCAEFGNDIIKSKTSFTNYTQKGGSKCYNNISDEGEAYNRLIEQFKELV